MKGNYDSMTCGCMDADNMPHPSVIQKANIKEKMQNIGQIKSGQNFYRDFHLARIKYL